MNGNGDNLFEFGAFSLDVSERRLLKDGHPIHLQPKAFETLLVLVANCGHLVTKEQLIDRVWADAFVEENNLTKNIYNLRKALNTGGGKYIETIPRVGYRFNPDLHPVSGNDDGDLIVEKVTNSRLLIRETIEEETFAVGSGKQYLRYVLALALAGLFVTAAIFAIFNIRDRAEASALATGSSKAEARENYLRGRALWQTRDAQDLHESTLLLERSIALDPTSAPARSALADAYAFDLVNHKNAEEQAREAIRLDPGLGEPHATIGFIRMFWDWNFADAETELKTAIELSPNYPTAHQWYAMNLAINGRKDAALWEIERALSLEPSSLSINSDRCQMLYFVHRQDEAREQCQRTLEMNGRFLNAHVNLYDIYLAKGEYAEAVEEHLAIQRLRSGAKYEAETPLEKSLRQAFADGGIRQFWKALIDESLTQQAAYYQLARCAARLGEREKAIYWLNQAYERHDPDLVLVAADPLFDEYHVGRDDLGFLKRLLNGN
jgi:DNA-binding winged helix-turn-helix (wHTH) protein/Flp pilus assembly protein TadD